jgi:hypothetical protein
MTDLDGQFYNCDPVPALWFYMKTNRAAFEFRGQNAR